MQDHQYDVVVIGSGPSGRTISLRSAKKGFSVALIESELVGGDCHYWACIPSKALLRPPEALAEARQVDGARQAASGHLSVESILARRDTFVDNWNDSKLADKLTENAVPVMRGHGRLNGPKRVVVTSVNGNNTTLAARHAVVLCTGSSAIIPEMQGLVQARPWTGRNATSAKNPPHHLAMMGDGPVACEMADAWCALGTKVTILSRHERILNKFEPFVGEFLAAAFVRRGISIRTNVSIREVERIDLQSPIQIVLDNGSNMSAEELLVAVGRKPNTKDLGLETVGLKPQQWLDIDDSCLVQGVNGEWLYAIGDINHRALLTHIGKYQARACAEAIQLRASGTYDGANEGGVWSKSAAKAGRSAISQVIFTDPQIASVGLTEQNSKDLKLNMRAVDHEISTLEGAKLHTDGYIGHARIIVDEDRHVIVGATFIGPQVGELLHSATIAIIGEVPLDRLWHAIPAFPTVSEVWVNLLENYGF
ncbi:MAG: NAD(P)/FAD-dependent oxidoreductase [Thermoproteota archaeon]|nr:NAD(P)/FAD-dependent oxidoreductase [Thermoproteota archaeon]